MLDGKCRIDGVLGIGGMGVVLAATHLHLQERVAVKIMLPELASDEEIVARFVREGRAAVRIKSPHVAKVLDVATRPSGEPYMIMEMLDGRDLDAVLTEQGRLPLATAVGYMLQACDALAEAHAKKIVHRDLKPSNMFLAEHDDGTSSIKLLDFGISKLVHEDGCSEGMSITKSRSILGSPLYMSPEQLRASRDVDARSDIWSLGVILYELVSGEPPFKGSTIAEIGALVLAGETPDLGKAVPSLPSAFVAAVRKCLARERDARFQSIVELVQAIGPYAAEEFRGLAAHTTRRAAMFDSSPILAAAAPSSSPSVDVLGPTAAKTGGAWSTGRRITRSRRNAFAVAFVATALAVSCFVGVALVLRARAPATPHPASSTSTPPAPSDLEPATLDIPAPATGVPSGAVAVPSGSVSAAPSASPITTAKTTARPAAKPPPEKKPQIAPPAATAPTAPQAPPTSDRFR